MIPYHFKVVICYSENGLSATNQLHLAKGLQWLDL